MSPGWNALIDDDYATVFPLPASEKYGIKYVATPAFSAEARNIFSRKSPGKGINEFMGLMYDTYRFIDLCTAQRTDDDRFIVTRKASYELLLEGSYEKLRAGFSVHCRRNIARAQKKKLKLKAM